MLAYPFPFLVDRANHGRQTENGFQQYPTPDDGRKFTELYNVQRLTSSTVDPTSRVCISTVRRVFSMLKGTELEEGNEEVPRIDTKMARGLLIYDSKRSGVSAGE